MLLHSRIGIMILSTSIPTFPVVMSTPPQPPPPSPPTQPHTNQTTQPSIPPPKFSFSFGGGAKKPPTKTALASSSTPSSSSRTKPKPSISFGADDEEDQDESLLLNSSKQGILNSGGSKERTWGKPKINPKSLVHQAVAPNRRQKVEQASAIQVDPSVFDYDGVWDGMKEAERLVKQRKEDGEASRQVSLDAA